MSLISTLNLASSALAVQQAAIQTTSNNIANAGNANYTRQVASTSSNKDHQIKPGVFVGTGINLTAIERQIDEALEGRLRNSVSDNEGAKLASTWLGRVEATFNELSDNDLSTQLSTFFNSWSTLANKPADMGLRQIVLQNGDALASSFQQLNGQLDALRGDVDKRVTALAGDANDLAQQIADLNGQIVVAEGAASGAMANGLRDNRDALLKEISSLMNVQTVAQDNGVVNVYVGSEPLVLGNENRGVAIKQETVDGKPVNTVVFKKTGGSMNITSGQLGALEDVHDTLATTQTSVNDLASNLIFELNKIHSAGQGLEGVASTTGSNQVLDAAASLNSSDAGLKFAATNGSFVVHVKDKSTGLVTSTLIKVDLDGLNADDTTLNSLTADIDGIANIGATINAGKLTVSADSSGVEISFSQDSSGTLAALGVNSFFNGKNASDIALNSTIKANAQLLAAAKNGEAGDNQTALAIAALETRAMKGLTGQSLEEKYQATVNGIATKAAASTTQAEATGSIRETLLSQREALSGVSMDEEAVNLIRQQRAFQGAARVITAVDEMMQTILAMVR